MAPTLWEKSVLEDLSKIPVAFGSFSVPLVLVHFAHNLLPQPKKNRCQYF